MGCSRGVRNLRTSAGCHDSTAHKPAQGGDGPVRDHPRGNPSGHTRSIAGDGAPSFGMIATCLAGRCRSSGRWAPHATLVALGGCSSSPSTAEVSACSAAITVIAPPTFPKGNGGVYFYDKEQISGVENSSNASMANAAKEWLAALAHSNQAEVRQAATKMLNACRQLVA